jgi:hypothetical protein
LPDYPGYPESSKYQFLARTAPRKNSLVA